MMKQKRREELAERKKVSERRRTRRALFGKMDAQKEGGRGEREKVANTFRIGEM